MPLSSTTVTIIGFGAFGKLLAGLLAPVCPLSVYDRCIQVRARAREGGFHVIDDPQDIGAGIVVLAVPVQAMPACLNEIAPYLRAGQLVMDVCSVKEEPARLMQAILPGEVEILACHPMFGPASGTGDVAGRQVVLCPLRGRMWRAVAIFLRRHYRLDVVVTTPEEHDRQAALSQGLMHLLARVVQPLTEVPQIRTRSYDLFAEAVSMVSGDAPEVFAAITQHNRHMVGVRERLRQGLDICGIAGAKDI